MIRVDQDDIALLLVHSIYKTKLINRKTADGKKEVLEKQILVKELRVNRWFRKDGIIGVQEYVTSKNTIAKKRCLVYDKYSNQYYLVNHSVEQVRKAIKYIPKNQIGFVICQ
jgi:hypothetical protein